MGLVTYLSLTVGVGGRWGGVGAYSRLGTNSRLGAYSNKYGKSYK